MLGALGLLAAWGVFGTAVARSVSRSESSWELALRGCILAFASSLAVFWTLCFVRAFGPASVLATSAVAAIIGAAMLARSWRPKSEKDGFPPWTLLVILPIFLLSLFVLWRGALLPVGNHDALSYHLPRAVLFLRDHGYKFVNLYDPRLGRWPADYELLLAALLASTGTDHGTMSISLVAYLALAAVAGAAAFRWWKSNFAASVAFVLCAAAPMAILHAGAHKNDLLFAFFAASAVHWLLPFALEASFASGLFGIAALALALGTKSHGALLAGMSSPLLLIGLWKVRRPNPRLTLVGVGVGVAAFLFLGGFVILSNVLHGVGLSLSIRSFQNATGPLYGDYANLWRFPLAILAVPFTSNGGLWMPGSADRYWWNEYDIFFGDYGAAFTLAIVAIPFVEWRMRNRKHRIERIVSIALLVVTFGSLLPLRVRPYGFFMQEARYYLAVIPLVFAWAVGPLATVVNPRVRLTALAGVSIWFAFVSQAVLRGDSSQPLAYVWDVALADTPPVRPLVDVFHRRVGYVLDQVAGPNDVVAVDLGYDTWIYPMFGRNFTRPVRFIGEGGEIPDDATWVAIDRGQQETFFASPQMTTLAFPLVQKYWGRGIPNPANFIVGNRLRNDPRFQLVYEDDASNQLLFRRR